MTEPAAARRPYGVGLAYRACLHREIVANAALIDVLEIPTEDYIIRRRRVMTDRTGEKLRDALAKFGCVGHGIGMSIGTVEPLDPEYMNRTRELLDETGMEEFSEHLAFHRMNGVDLEIFQCMPFTEESLDWLTAQYWQAREWLGRPIGLENVSYSPKVQHCDMTEAEFLTELTRRTDCFLLLDVTNVFNNAFNHNYDAAEFIRSLPGDRVRHMHLAGGYFADGMWHDSHDATVQPKVWELFELALQVTAAEIVILERDGNFMPFDRVMQDVRRAREIFYRHRPKEAPPKAAPPQIKIPRATAGDSTVLKSYQAATMRRITDDEFRQRAAADRSTIAREYALDEIWQNRWRDIDERALRFQVSKWKYNAKRVVDEEAAYRRFEFQQWNAMSPS
jgi:uncharacterized protein (UPF0276 family)